MEGPADPSPPPSPDRLARMEQLARAELARATAALDGFHAARQSAVARPDLVDEECATSIRALARRVHAEIDAVAEAVGTLAAVAELRRQAALRKAGLP